MCLCLKAFCLNRSQKFITNIYRKWEELDNDDEHSDVSLELVVMEDEYYHRLKIISSFIPFLSCLLSYLVFSSYFSYNNLTSIFCQISNPFLVIFTFKLTLRV